VSEAAFEADAVAVAIWKLITTDTSSDGFEGTATVLLEEINNKVSEVTRKSKYWPQNAAQLGNRSARGTVAEGQGLHRRAPAQRRTRHHHHPTEELGEHLLKRRSRKKISNQSPTPISLE
jgi:hypothetical protein